LKRMIYMKIGEIKKISDEIMARPLMEYDTK
jgi:hypothetical protein